MLNAVHCEYTMCIHILYIYFCYIFFVSLCYLFLPCFLFCGIMSVLGLAWRLGQIQGWRIRSRFVARSYRCAKKLLYFFFSFRIHLHFFLQLHSDSRVGGMEVSHVLLCACTVQKKNQVGTTTIPGRRSLPALQWHGNQSRPAQSSQGLEQNDNSLLPHGSDSGLGGHATM